MMSQSSRANAEAEVAATLSQIFNLRNKSRHLESLWNKKVTTALYPLESLGRIAFVSLSLWAAASFVADISISMTEVSAAAIGIVIYEGIKLLLRERTRRAQAIEFATLGGEKFLLDLEDLEAQLCRNCADLLSIDISAALKNKDSTEHELGFEPLSSINQLALTYGLKETDFVTIRLPSARNTGIGAGFLFEPQSVQSPQ